ncbi:TIGR02594 family protein [Bradyrhizobium sp. AUGA SZCCT0158]|uniref:NlpC/P60 family protein n=1 Tax=Bradyrhizobium sp. AUGA SZCCT0158 TaxID=2807661 RepID=UPI001BA578B0|nr:TIGR02594 family protein [Bradyrhizobium sp. AUGA SZCCT0158]MBR1198814.1 TIGR02594 family protein [Bradyrhizobium sp. AUGA SZCCT0158]
MTIAALVAAGPLRLGAIGPAVTAVQLALRNDGRDIQADGEFGPVTQTALKAFEAAHGLKPDGIVDGPTAAALDKIAPPTSVMKVAPWLATMRALTGLKEAPGSKDNPFIIEMAHEIVRRYPDLKGNVGWYNHDSIPWCGLQLAYVMAVNGIKPSKAPLSSLDWASWGQKLSVPTPGAVLIYTRTGGGHITLYESEDANWIYCRGGNQSDGLNVTKIPKSRKIHAIRWPAGVSLPTAGRKFGATGNAVKAGSEA